MTHGLLPHFLHILLPLHLLVSPLTLSFFISAPFVWLSYLYFLPGYWLVSFLLNQFEWQTFTVYKRNIPQQCYAIKRWVLDGDITFMREALYSMFSIAVAKCIGEMAQWIKALDTKPHEPVFNPWAHTRGLASASCPLTHVLSHTPRHVPCPHWKIKLCDNKKNQDTS